MALHITKHTTGKMKGFRSINTSVINNEFCSSMACNTNNVCSKCYANRLERFRASLRINLATNSTLLSVPLSTENIPIFNPNEKVRIHSFGELINNNHLENIINIATTNKSTTFTLFTKRIDLLNTYNEKMPSNIIVIVSSPQVNVSYDIKALPSCVKKVFTVYNKDSNVEINCSQSCASCMKCYNINDSTQYINEELR